MPENHWLIHLLSTERSNAHHISVRNLYHNRSQNSIINLRIERKYIVSECHADFHTLKRFFG